MAVGQTMAQDTARADGPWGRVDGEPCDSGRSPASAARRRGVMKRQTVRAEWVSPSARISGQSCRLSALLSRQRRLREGRYGVNTPVDGRR